jgi:ATP-binding cassette subfamily B protein
MNETDLDARLWPLSRLGEAIEAVARKCELFAGPVQDLASPRWHESSEAESLATWIDAAAARLGIDAEPVAVAYAEVQRFLAQSGPLLLRFSNKNAPHFAAVIGRRGKWVIVLGPDLAEYRVSPEALRFALCRRFEGPVSHRIEKVLRAVSISERDSPRVRAAILQETLNAVRLDGVWSLRLSPQAAFLTQLSRAGLGRRALGLISVYTTQYFLFLLSWWLVGKAALEGHFERGWLLAWALLLLTMIPLRLFTTWSQGLAAIRAGALLKQRLLYGALRLDPEEMRHQGAGQLLGRVIESESVESLALSFGFFGLFAFIELIFATAILYAGAGGLLHVAVLCAWIGGSLFLGWLYYRRRSNWTQTRLDITHDLVERMVGHRTVLAQELRERWHDREDQALEHYLKRSLEMDRAGVLLAQLVPRGWLVFGLIGLAPAFIWRGGTSPAELAIGLGGILLAYGALGQLVSGIRVFAGAAISWSQVKDLFHAARRPEIAGSPAYVTNSATGHADSIGREILVAHDLSFSYRDRGEPAVNGLSLSVRAGERLLLEGPSGGGKSTLVMLLAGLRLPNTGLILLDGLDRQTLGSAGWRQRVAVAPQFHENRLLTETLAFNLLMGRRWPPVDDDLAEAEAVCRELGLGDLLGRMPAGLFQMVGESGWQLSHGERSRVYIARALLQQADLVIFDESFAALDPENLAKALGCALNRASSLIVIAHP